MIDLKSQDLSEDQKKVMMYLQERIIIMASWVANVPPSHICETTHFSDDLGFDSIDILTLVMQLEKWFNIILTKDEFDRIETVKDASECFSKYYGQAAA
jgi:acyl carrier protein